MSGFDTFQARALSYGAVSSGIARELFRALSVDGVHYDDHAKKSTVLTPPSLAIFNNKTKCFTDQYMKVGITNNLLNWI